MQETYEEGVAGELRRHGGSAVDGHNPLVVGKQSPPQPALLCTSAPANQASRACASLPIRCAQPQCALTQCRDSDSARPFSHHGQVLGCSAPRRPR